MTNFVMIVDRSKPSIKGERVSKVWPARLGRKYETCPNCLGQATIKELDISKKEAFVYCQKCKSSFCVENLESNTIIYLSQEEIYQSSIK